MMLGTIYSELAVDLTLQPRSPLLVKAGDTPREPEAEAERLAGLSFAEMMTYFTKLQAKEEKDAREETKAQTRQARDAARKERQVFDDAADMPFVLTRRNGRDEPYLPGSSLKGVMRSWCERLARTMSPTERVCDLFDKDKSCAGQWSETSRPAGPLAYNGACPLCRTFGHLYLAGRFAVGDAYLASSEEIPPRLTRRDGVGIDRRRGAAAEGAKYDYEIWDRGAFYGSLRLRNFEIWQVGLLAHLLGALGEGEIRFGHGTRRGLGRLEGRVQELTVTYFGRAARHGEPGAMPLLGLSHLVQETEYKFYRDPTEPPLIAGAVAEDQGLRRSWRFGPEAQEALWQAAGPVWNAFIGSTEGAEGRTDV